MAPPVSKPLLLIVEDVDSMRSLLEQLFAEDFRVRTARNTVEARVELLRRRPEVVLLDEILPGESSLDLLAEIKVQGLPVILMTGLENPNHPVPEGASCRLMKPTFDTFSQDQKRLVQAVQGAISGVLVNV